MSEPDLAFRKKAASLPLQGAGGGEVLLHLVFGFRTYWKNDFYAEGVFQTVHSYRLPKLQHNGERKSHADL